MIKKRDLSLIRWAEALRRDRGRRRRRALRCTIALAGFTALAATIVAPPRPRLVWNASSSAPTGLYWVSPADNLVPGDMVIAWVPRPWRRLAADRHYVPLNVPLVKRVAAISGDEICDRDGQIFVNRRWMAWRRPVDGRGRPLPAWHGCQRLGDGMLFLLMDARDSFDGRYFGPTSRDDIVGRATLLWAR